MWSHPIVLTCLKNLGLKTFVNEFISPNIESTFCTLSFNRCFSNGSISDLVLRQNNTQLLSWNDFSCFSSINTLKLYNSYVESDFIYNPISTIKQLYLYPKSNIDSIDQELPSYDSLTLSNLTNSYVLKSSYLKNVKSFFMFGGLIILDIDGDQSNSVLEILSIYTDSFPIVTGFPKLKTLFIYSGFNSIFNESSLVNLAPLNKITSLQLDINSPNVEIFSHITSISNSSLNYIYIGTGTQMGAAKQKYDLSNFEKLDQILIMGDNKYFNYEGQFPFSSLPPKMSALFFQNGNFSLPDINFFENCTSVSFNTFSGSNVYGTLPNYTLSKKVSFSMSNNKLTGTIDKSWCNINADFSKNLLSGELPECFYCFLNDSNISNNLKGNNFSNFNTNNQDCGYSQISIYSIKFIGSSLNIYGKNIGPYQNIISTPPLILSTNNIDGSISGFIMTPIGDLTTIEFRLKSPGINFTIAVKPQNPTIDNIIQNNNTFIIYGTYFSYNQSSINVIVGNNICKVLSSTFYQIQCEISYPVVDRGNVQMRVTVDGSLTSSKSFQITQTNQPCNPNDCNGNGVCDHVYGICKCNSKWVTVGNQVCLITNHFISSSTQVDSTTGGNITLYGSFGLDHLSNQLIIDGLISTIFSIDDNSILTSIQPGTGGKSITFIQNSITWSGTVYPYIIKNFKCPNDCGGNGACNTLNGQCECLKGYTGFDCSPLPIVNTKDEPLSTTFIAPSGLTTISNEQTGYQLSIDSVVEIDFNGNNIPNSLIKLSGNWKLENNQNSISIFKQQVENTIFILTIEEIENSDKQFSFAGNNFTISKGGIKISFSISNWNYQSNLNTLRVEMISDIKINENKDINTCNDDNSESSFESLSNSQSDTGTLNYLKFSINGKILQGRFQDKMLSDGRPTPTFSKVLSKTNNMVTIGLDLPHCIECLLDPDFSVLLSSDFKSSDSCKSNDKKPWLIPVVVVVPVVVVATIITIIIVMAKKNSVKLRIGLRNISMGSIKDRSRK
ncbi:hypothetical protein ACTFIZ_006205 [Dictyostelium cf. discoideum]